MKNPVKRLIGTIVVALVFLIVYTALLLNIEQRHNNELILVSYSNSPLARHSVLSFVIRGNWTKGINLFSGIAVVVTFCIEYLAYLTLKMITLILVSLTDTKGETICDMLPPLSLTLRSRGFLFDSPIGLSINRLSPRAPRFFLSP